MPLLCIISNLQDLNKYTLEVGQTGLNHIELKCHHDIPTLHKLSFLLLPNFV